MNTFLHPLLVVSRRRDIIATQNPIGCNQRLDEVAIQLYLEEHVGLSEDLLLVLEELEADEDGLDAPQRGAVPQPLHLRQRDLPRHLQVHVHHVLDLQLAIVLYNMKPIPVIRHNFC